MNLVGIFLCHSSTTVWALGTGEKKGGGDVLGLCVVGLQSELKKDLLGSGGQHHMDDRGAQARQGPTHGHGVAVCTVLSICDDCDSCMSQDPAEKQNQRDIETHTIDPL